MPASRKASGKTKSAAAAVNATPAKATPPSAQRSTPAGKQRGQGGQGGRGGRSGKPKASASKGQGAMWAGRFSSGMAESLERLSFSLAFDQKLFREDIAGSIGHVHGLHAAKVVTAKERDALISGLEGIRADLEAGRKLFAASDEDIHMAVERVLTERIGALGKKLHTGRSRNDQVATDFRLYVRSRALSVEARVVELQHALLDLATRYRKDLMPGYTHVQQAQPIYIAHYLLSFFFALERDKARLRHAAESAGEMPLGSGALAGSAFPYPRETVAARLGFAAPSRNSIDATAHRDFALEFLHALNSLGLLLSTYAEDFVLFSSQEYGYVKLGEAFTTGSSMMPQKRNPDCMELIRGKAGRLLGNYVRLATVLKGLPHAYDRDLQEDKEGVFDSVETAETCLEVMAGAIASAEFRTETILSKMHPAMLATDLADYLVEKGVPFRDAHHMVGRLIAEAESEGVSFLELSEEAWKDIPDGKAFRKRLTFAYSAERRSIRGGTGSASVTAQLREAELCLRPVKSGSRKKA